MCSVQLVLFGFALKKPFNKLKLLVQNVDFLCGCFSEIFLLYKFFYVVDHKRNVTLKYLRLSKIFI